MTGPNELGEFFNDAPVGEILGSRAEGVVAQFKGPDDALIQEQVIGPPRTALDAGDYANAGWDKVIELLNQLVG